MSKAAYERSQCAGGALFISLRTGTYFRSSLLSTQKVTFRVERSDDRKHVCVPRLHFRLFYRLNGVSKSAYTKFSLTRGGQGSTVNILIFFFFHSYLVGIIVRHTSFNLVVSRLSIISLRAQLAKMKGVWNLLEVKR